MRIDDLLKQAKEIVFTWEKQDGLVVITPAYEGEGVKPPLNPFMDLLAVVMRENRHGVKNSRGDTSLRYGAEKIPSMDEQIKIIDQYREKLNSLLDKYQRLPEEQKAKYDFSISVQSFKVKDALIELGVDFNDSKAGSFNRGINFWERQPRAPGKGWEDYKKMDPLPPLEIELDPEQTEAAMAIFKTCEFYRVERQPCPEEWLEKDCYQEAKQDGAPFVSDLYTLRGKFTYRQLILMTTFLNDELARRGHRRADGGQFSVSYFMDEGDWADDPPYYAVDADKAPRESAFFIAFPKGDAISSGVLHKTLCDFCDNRPRDPSAPTGVDPSAWRYDRA